MSQIGPILVTGPPGVGKTTLVNKIGKVLMDKGSNVAGFYTEEVRVQGTRIGFDVVTIDGQRRSVLARTMLDKPSKFCVGKYMVDVASFESTALGVLTTECDIMIIDEIGKMESFSEDFQKAVKDVFREHRAMIIATIPIAKNKPLPLVDELLKQQRHTLFTVSKSNRDALVNTIIDHVLSQSSE